MKYVNFLNFAVIFFLILDTSSSKTINMRRMPTYLPFYRTLGLYSKKLHRNFMSKSVRFLPSHFLDLEPNATSKRNYNSSVLLKLVFALDCNGQC